jgi:hypothetical protein
MTWFHFTKQDRIRRNRELRREQAETCRKEAAENVFMIGRTVDGAVKTAGEEERLFTDYFAEPMPQHLQMALRLEILLWRRIQAALERANAATMDDASYKKLEEGTRTLLLAIINLLHAEEEMLTSCLVRHYVTIIQDVQADAARVTL